MNSVAEKGFVSRAWVGSVDVAGMPAKEMFFHALDAYRHNPCFCVPHDARAVIEKFGTNTKYVLLGSKDFAAAFIAGISSKGTVLYVVDDFKCHRGEQFSGVDIISTDVFLGLASKDPSIIAINCCRFDYSKRFFDDFCRNHGIPHLNHEQATRILGLNSTLDHRMADWAEEISSRTDEFVALGERLSDNYSQETLWRVLTFHLTCDPEWHLNVAKPYSTLYFRTGLLSFGEHEKFVDCGASIAESTTALIGTTHGKFDRSWMIEPDRFNIKTLQKFLRKYAGTPLDGKMTLHPYAVGEDFGSAPFNHMGGHGGTLFPIGSEAVTGSVEIRPLDSILDDVPTFIKMDLEGFEMPALRGSIKSIQASRPKLAISAYHRSSDLLEIPAFIDSIAPGYRIGLRHHTEDRWDTCLYFW